MARRQSAASRSSSQSRRRASAGTSAAGGGRARRDGKIDVSCPQCGAAYRVGQDMLDAKIECTECHRVFFAKTTAGKRAVKPDYTKAYLGFGFAAVAIVALFLISSNSGGGEPRQKPAVQAPKAAPYTVGTHPRALQLVQWAQSIGDNNHLVMKTHSDLAALAQKLEVDGSDEAAVLAALKTSEATRYLRDLRCDSAALDSEADMTAATGSGVVYVTPKADDDNYKRNTRGELAVTFRTDGNQIKVTGFEVKMKPIWNSAKQMPGTVTYKPNEDIAKPAATEITDSAGTRTVAESEPAPVPHWQGATPEQRAMADQVVADIIKSADNESPGGLFNRAIFKIQSDEDKRACVPRVLNAMFERYADVNAANMELSQLNQALAGWTAHPVNYQVKSSGDAQKDAKERQSCIRQWFAFWYSHHDNPSRFFDQGDVLDLEPVDPTDPNRKKKN